MTFQLAPPSRNPTIDRRLKSVLKFVFGKLVQGTLNDMLPGMVVAYDRATNLATVQPLIQMVTTLDEAKPLGNLELIPVTQLGGGGFMTNYPLIPGDLGWIKANDRDLSLFKQIFAMTAPNTGRMHSFEDATFIPVTFKGFTIQSGDANNLVIQSLDGTTAITMGGGKINFRAPNGFIFTGPTLSNTGDIIADQGTSNISLETHVHSGVTTGGGNTGEPV